MNKTYKRRCKFTCEFHEYLQIFNNLTNIFTYEMYRQTSKEEYLKIPKNLAGKEFSTLQADGLTRLEAKNK